MSAALLVTNPVPACYTMTATRDILEIRSNFHGSSFDLLQQFFVRVVTVTYSG